MSSNNFGGLTGLPVLETVGGREQIVFSNAAAKVLTVPDWAVACSIVVFDVLAPTGIVASYKFGATPTAGNGNPIFNAMYFELTTYEAMINFSVIGADANNKTIYIQYYR